MVEISSDETDVRKASRLLKVTARDQSGTVLRLKTNGEVPKYRGEIDNPKRLVVDLFGIQSKIHDLEGERGRGRWRADWATFEKNPGGCRSQQEPLARLRRCFHGRRFGAGVCQVGRVSQKLTATRTLGAMKVDAHSNFDRITLERAHRRSAVQCAERTHHRVEEFI